MALEGGGSRGAYHIGVMKAFVEAGYEFDGFVGTSIGAINAAMFVQGDFKKAEEIWLGLSTGQLFDTDIMSLIELHESKWDIRALGSARDGLRNVRNNKGVDTSKIKAFVNKHLNEERIRTSGKDFGLAVTSVSDRQPFELFSERIPQGEMLSYIVASACLPGFKPEIIGGKAYIDGALHNNCPINMLIAKGYDKIIAVRTNAPGVFPRYTTPANVDVKIIASENNLGNMMIFSPDKIRGNISLGYCDGLQALRELQ